MVVVSSNRKSLLQNKYCSNPIKVDAAHLLDGRAKGSPGWLAVWLPVNAAHPLGIPVGGKGPRGRLMPVDVAHPLVG